MSGYKGDGADFLETGSKEAEGRRRPLPYPSSGRAGKEGW